MTNDLDIHFSFTCGNAQTAVLAYTNLYCTFQYEKKMKMTHNFGQSTAIAASLLDGHACQCEQQNSSSYSSSSSQSTAALSYNMHQIRLFPENGEQHLHARQTQAMKHRQSRKQEKWLGLSRLSMYGSAQATLSIALPPSTQT